MFPAKIKEVFDHIIDCAKNKKIGRIIIKAPRGGGKSRVLASIELVLWYVYDFDIVNLGGSFVQASKVYQYLSEAFYSDLIKPCLQKSIRVETTKKKEFGRGKIYVLAATEKQTRSPHVGGQTRGGALFIDEECEAEEDIVKSAIPIVDTANPSVIVRSSTFHTAFGSYQKCWDNAATMGYKQLTWDCFDVSQLCKDDCQNVMDRATGKVGPCIVLDYCKGKSHQSEGWIPIEEIRQARREMSAEEFEIEMMGSRPSSASLVYSPSRLLECIKPQVFKLDGRGSASVGVDWGYGETAITLMQEQYSEEKKKWVKRILDAQAFNQAKEEEIYNVLEVISKSWSIPLYLDSSHVFQNQALEGRGATIYPVNFAMMKDYGINNVKKMMEDGLLEIPEEFTYFIDQLKNYRRNKNTGKPLKLDDHGADSLLSFLDSKKRVLTDNGWTAVGKLKVGDLVLTHKGRFKKITSYQPKQYTKDHQVVLNVHGKSHRVDSFITTIEHPYLTEDGRWVKAEDVKVGDKLMFLASRCPICNEKIPFYRKACGQHKGNVANLRWSNPGHKEKIERSKKRQQLLDEYKNGGREAKTNASKATQVRAEQLRNNPDLREKNRLFLKSLLPLVNTPEKRERQSVLMKSLHKRPGFFDHLRTEYGRNRLRTKVIERIIRGRLIPFNCRINQFTDIENMMFKAFGDLGFNPQHNLHIGRWFIDVALVDFKVAIECDGGNWHDSLKAKERDRKKDAYLNNNGWTVFRFKGDEIKKNLDDCTDRVLRIIGNHEGLYDFMPLAVINVKTEKLKTKKIAYHFEVEEDKSYVADGIVSHNCAAFHFSEEGSGSTQGEPRVEVVDPFKFRRRIY